jgi:hypothetical protein
MQWRCWQRQLQPQQHQHADRTVWVGLCVVCMGPISPSSGMQACGSGDSGRAVSSTGWQQHCLQQRRCSRAPCRTVVCVSTCAVQHIWQRFKWLGACIYPSLHCNACDKQALLIAPATLQAVCGRLCGGLGSRRVYALRIRCVVAWH